MDYKLVSKILTSGLVFCVLAQRTVACTWNEMMYVWPLGQGIGVTDIKTNTSDGTENNVQFMPISLNADTYDTMMFTGSVDSFAEINVLHYSGQKDFSIQMYAYFNDTTSGTIMAFRSNVLNESTLIQQFSVNLVDSNIEINVSNFGTLQFDKPFAAHTWHYIQLRRDESKEFFSIFIADGSEIMSTVEVKSLKSVLLNLPGTLKLGVDYADQNPLRGAISCLQWSQSKQFCGQNSDANCNVNYWRPASTSTLPPTTTTVPPTTSTVPPTTTTVPPTTTTVPATTSTMTPTTTSVPPTTSTMTPTTTTVPPTTTTVPPTTTTVPPTTSTVPPTTTTVPPTTTTVPSTTSTMTPTTTSVPPTTSTMTPTTTTVPPTTTTVPPTTTTVPPTTTTVPPTTSTMTPSTTTAPPTMSIVSTYTVNEECLRFERSALDATFSNLPDIIDVVNVENVGNCASRCNMNPSCKSFAVKSISASFYECRMGSVASATTVYELGSMLFGRI